MGMTNYYTTMTLTMKLILKDKQHLFDNLLQLVFTTDGSHGSLPSFKPGQFITFRFQDGQGPFRRSYSLGNLPTTNHWEFYVALFDGGRGSSQLLRLAIGDRVTIDPPTGIFTLDKRPGKRLVLIATSTGVVPFRSMRHQLEQLLAEDHQISLLQGVRSSEYLLFRDEWYDLLSTHDGFEYVPCFSRPQSSQECQRYGAIHGPVQTALTRLPLISPENQYFLCGNPDMVTETEALLHQSGVGLHQIMVEAFESLAL